MSILKSILEAQGGSAVRQLARQHGIQEAQAAAALSQLLPAIAGGLKQNMASPEGLQALLGALNSGDHGRYVDDPSLLGHAAAINDGNGILSHILGSKDASRQVASRAAQSTGLDVNLLKRMLPAVAALAMAAMSRQRSGTPETPAAGAAVASQRGGTLGMLTQFLDTDGDGSIANELMGLARKFL